MLVAGAFGFGAVLGWAGGFVAPGRRGLLFRLALLVAGAASLLGFGWDAAAAGALGFALAGLAHDILIIELNRGWR